MKKEIGIIGLGRMGRNIALHIAEQDIKVIAYNRTYEKTIKFVEEVKKLGGDAIAVKSYQELATTFTNQKTVIMYLPALEPTDNAVHELIKLFNDGDIIIDGSNNHYKEAIKHYKIAKEKNIGFIDCGTSGGINGARNGACLMIGGDKNIFQQSRWVFKAIAMQNGYEYMGAAGSGNFVKTIHNGIEYAILQAYGEGFHILKESPYKNLDFLKIAKVWNHGSVIRSWMLELLEEKFKNEPLLQNYLGEIGGGQTGTWASEMAKEQETPSPSIDLALKLRKESKINPTFSGKVIAAIRNGFGGHKFKKLS